MEVGRPSASWTMDTFRPARVVADDRLPSLSYRYRSDSVALAGDRRWTGAPSAFATVVYCCPSASVNVTDRAASSKLVRDVPCPGAVTLVSRLSRSYATVETCPSAFVTV